ncbi:MAG TPA: FAD-dependent oxidoreductase [Anaerolineales bacterium]|nr:FAD-dependent oxidoreductase [Anaerolineales bacterium]
MADREVDVLVVGAGPAGLAAAIELKARGVRSVLVVDREPAAGGVPRHCDHTGFGLRDLRRVLSGPAYARRYVAAAERAGVEIRTRVTVTDWPEDRRVRTTSPDGIDEIQARAVVLATGSRERPRAARLVPGDRPEGVFTTGSLQRFIHDHAHPVGERALVAGAEHVSYSAVHTLRSAGLSIAGMVTEHPRHQSFGIYIRIARGLSDFPLFTDSKITNILGRRRVEAVEVTHLPTGAVREIGCDTVVFTGDWIPDREVARAAGLPLDPGTLGPAVDHRLRTGCEGVFAAGNLVHPGETADTAALSGRVAARAAAEYLRSGTWRPVRGIGFDFDPELVQWVTPNVIEPGEAAHLGARFILRVARVLEYPVLEIRQGERLLWRRRYRRLVPNLPYALPVAVLQGVDGGGGAVRISFARR